MSADKITPQHPRPVEDRDDQHLWLTKYRSDVPAQFTHGAILLYRDWRNQKAWADGRLEAYEGAMRELSAETFEHQLTKAKVVFWRVMSCTMAAMLFGVWANTYIFGGAA